MFLRHVERCQCLLYVIDVSNVDPLRQLKALQYEMNMYQYNMSSRPSLFIANKIDLLDDEHSVLERLRCDVDMPVVAVSAKYGYNIKVLKEMIKSILIPTKHQHLNGNCNN